MTFYKSSVPGPGFCCGANGGVPCAWGATKAVLALARMRPAVGWLLDQQVSPGRWANRYAHEGKMLVDIDVPGDLSRWVTLRAARVLTSVALATAHPGDGPTTWAAALASRGRRDSAA